MGLVKPFRQTSLCQIPKPLPLAHPRSADQKLPRLFQCRHGIDHIDGKPEYHRREKDRWQPDAPDADQIGKETVQVVAAAAPTSTETVVKSWLQRFAFPNAPVPSSVPSMTAAAVPKPPQNSSAIPCSVPMIWSDACAWVPVYLYATL